MAQALSEAPKTTASRRGVRSVAIGIVCNCFLAVIKATAGIAGNSHALLADAIESAADVFGSIVSIAGLKLAEKPADDTHPYGHGKFEPLAAAAVSMTLLGAAILIAVESFREILMPRHAPAPFTLIVLLLTILLKEILFRSIARVGDEVSSNLVKTEAWHHRSDAVTSSAAFVGIAVALIGGKGYESADSFAALLASGVIAVNALLLLRPAIYELIDTAPDPAIAQKVREIAEKVPGVMGTHKCHVRKVGFDYFVDLDILCDPNATIRSGHDIAHAAGKAIQESLPHITKVLVHVEPVDDYGRRS